MAVVERFIDDIDGKDLDKSKAIKFKVTVDGENFEVDTTENNKARAIKQIKAILGMKSPSQELMDSGQRAVVASWINKNIEKTVVASRGRIKQSLLDEFDKAHSG